jgi:hypothetical protein
MVRIGGGVCARLRRCSGVPGGSTNDCGADVTVSVHGANERLVPGAKVTAAWSGAVGKTATCATSANGTCTLKSGTLRYLRSAVMLSVSSVVLPGSTFNAAASHDSGGATNALVVIRR